MDKELTNRFRKAFRLFAREFMFINQNMKYSDLTVLQRHAILEIGENPCVSLGTLADILAADKGNTSRTVNDLVALGYVDRSTDPSSRRSVVLNLTKEGMSVFNAIVKMSTAYFGKVFSRISPEDVETVINGLALLSENMHKENQSITDFLGRHIGKSKKGS